MGQLLKQTNEDNKESVGDKYNRVDIFVKVKDSKDHLIIVGIQNRKEADYYYKYYDILGNISGSTSEPLKRSLPYREIKKLVIVSVVYFDLGEGEDYVYYGGSLLKGIHKNDTLELSEIQRQIFQKEMLPAISQEHVIIRLNDFDDIARDGLDEWIYFLKNNEIKDEFNAKGLAEAREKLKEINLPEEELVTYRRYLENLKFEASIAQDFRFDLEYAEREGMKKGMEKGIKKGRAEGENKGKKEGLKEGKVEMAKMLKENGVDISLISKSSGLSKEEIESL